MISINEIETGMYELDYARVAVSSRAAQAKLAWGCLIGIFKRLPVTVYEGAVTLEHRK